MTQQYKYTVNTHASLWIFLLTCEIRLCLRKSILYSYHRNSRTGISSAMKLGPGSNHENEVNTGGWGWLTHLLRCGRFLLQLCCLFILDLLKTASLLVAFLPRLQLLLLAQLFTEGQRTTVKETTPSRPEQTFNRACGRRPIGAIMISSRPVNTSACTRSLGIYFQFMSSAKTRHRFHVKKLKVLLWSWRYCPLSTRTPWANTEQ